MMTRRHCGWLGAVLVLFAAVGCGETGTTKTPDVANIKPFPSTAAPAQGASAAVAPVEAKTDAPSTETK
jgi:hypothetical protein